MTDKNLIMGRSFYYEFFAMPFFFSETDEKFQIWKKQLEYLKTSPITTSNLADFEAIEKFDFKGFRDEQNTVLFDYSYTNIPTTASFYDEGRDDGVAKKLVVDTLRKSKFRKNNELCKDSEDFIGFIFYAMSSLLKEESDKGTFLSTELFVNTINNFIDEFIGFMQESKHTNLYKHLSNLMESFFELERSLLGVEKPEAKPSKAKESMVKQPYFTNLAQPNEKFNWAE